LLQVRGARAAYPCGTPAITGIRCLRVAGICVFRNAADFIGLVVLHHLIELVDHVYCVDNGSTDGSLERIEWLRHRSSQITLISDSAIRPKREHMTALAQRAHGDGFDVILPFDSDELWHGTRASLWEAFAHGQNVLRCPVLNFIQRRSVERLSWFAWRHAIRRCTITDTLHTRVTSGEISFLECEFPSKVAFLSDPSAELQNGQHGVILSNNREVRSTTIALFHLPIRAKSELLKRAYDYEPRRVTFRANPHQDWQGLYWQRRVVGGDVDSEWQALSYDERGELWVNHRRVPTFIDRRLVAYLYRAALTRRYGFAGLRMLKTTEKATPIL
jgi:hypothetical protein